jgi:hypothetical protein
MPQDEDLVYPGVSPLPLAPSPRTGQQCRHPGAAYHRYGTPQLEHGISVSVPL